MTRRLPRRRARPARGPVTSSSARNPTTRRTRPTSSGPTRATATRSSRCSPTASMPTCCGGRRRRATHASWRTSRSATTTSTSRAATEHGITVCNTPGVLDETTADTAFLLILAASPARVDCGGRPAQRTLAGLGRHPVPRPRRARRDARARRLRPHRARGGSTRPRASACTCCTTRADPRRAGLRRRSRRTAR